MKKYIFFLTYFLFIASFSAQKKSKSKKPLPPKKEEFVPPPISQESGASNDNDMSLVMPASDLTRINATKTNGQKIRINSINELESLDFSQLKELSFSTMISDQSLDNKILQKIINEANQLEVLEIVNFTIEKFPEIKAQNRHLKKIILDKNNLKAIPESISNLAALENFSSGNPLQKLPDSFSQLKNIKELSLNYTEFSEFPKVIFSLNKLSFLYVSGNYKGNIKIRELPDMFQQLPELKEVGITNASLSQLPMSFSGLKKLKKVNFSNNQFTEFPEVLAVNPNLEFVPFTNNPLKWNEFLTSIKKIKWRGLFFLNETGFTKKQYEEIQKILTKIDVYYDGMND
jgi:Leucine-rich repeat (LRR) protein